MRFFRRSPKRPDVDEIEFYAGPYDGLFWNPKTGHFRLHEVNEEKNALMGQQRLKQSAWAVAGDVEIGHLEVRGPSGFVTYELSTPGGRWTFKSGSERALS